MSVPPDTGPGDGEPPVPPTPDPDATDIHITVGGIALDKVIRIEGSLPFVIEHDRSLCGQTYNVPNDDEDWSVTIEARVGLTTWLKLKGLRGSSPNVQISSAGNSGTVALGALQFKRTDNMDTIHTSRGEEPMFTVTIQTREQSNSLEVDAENIVS